MLKVDMETTGHGMILELTLGKVNQKSIPLRNGVRGSLEMELLCFGLEVTTTLEEPQNNCDTLQSEKCSVREI